MVLVVIVGTLYAMGAVAAVVAAFLMGRLISSPCWFLSLAFRAAVLGTVAIAMFATHVQLKRQHSQRAASSATVALLVGFVDLGSTLYNGMRLGFSATETVGDLVLFSGLAVSWLLIRRVRA